MVIIVVMIIMIVTVTIQKGMQKPTKMNAYDTSITTNWGQKGVQRHAHGAKKEGNSTQTECHQTYQNLPKLTETHKNNKSKVRVAQAKRGQKFQGFPRLTLSQHPAQGAHPRLRRTRVTVTVLGPMQPVPQNTCRR